MKKLVLALFVSISALWATETRIQTLSSSPDIMVDDEVNAIMYPSNAYLFGSFGNVYLGSQEDDEKLGYGFLRMKNWNFGVLLGKPTLELLGDTSHIGNKLFVAYQRDKFSFGIGLGFASYSFRETTLNVINSKTISQLFEIHPGITFRVPQKRLDISFKLDIPMKKEEDYTTNVFSEFSGKPSFEIRTRLVLGNKDFSKILAVSYRFDDLSHRDWSNIDTTEHTWKHKILSAQAGFIVRPQKGLFLTGVLVYEFDKMNLKTNSSSTVTSNINTVKISGGIEKKILNFFTLRSSLEKIIWNSRKDTSSSEIVSIFGEPTRFTVGTGLNIGKLRFDAAISTDIFYKGFYFLTGNQSELVYDLSINYRF